MELTLDQALQKGVEAHKAGKVQEADRYYTAILKANPKHPDANHNMGVLAVDIGKVETALPFFKTALEANSSIAQYWLSYIDALIKLDRMEEAKVVFDQAKSKRAHGKAFDQIEQQLNAFSVTVKNETRGDIFGPPNILGELKLDKALKLAKKKTEDGSSDEAKRIYLDILDRFPKNKKALDGIKKLATTALSNKSDIKELTKDQFLNFANLYSQGKFQEILNKGSQLLEYFPSSFMLYNITGAASKRLGKLDEAVDAYSKALFIKPDYADAHYNMGIALKDQGKLNESIEAYKKALTIKPDYADAYYNLGNALKDYGKLDEALAAYKKALTIKPDYVEAYNNMGIALKDYGKLDEALAAYKKALTIKPDYEDAYNNMGLAFVEEGRLDKAIDAYSKALAIKPNNAEAYNNMGIALTEIGKLDQALEAFTKALSIKAQYPEACNNMGIALTEVGKLDQALEAFTKALSIKAQYPEAYTNMGNVLKKQGKLEEAIKAFTKALSLRPDTSEAIVNASVLRNQLLDTTLINEEFEKRLNVHSIKLLEMPKFQILQAIRAFLLSDKKSVREHLKSYNSCTQSSIAKLKSNDQVFCFAYNTFLQKLIETPLENGATFADNQTVFHLGESHCLSYAHRLIKIQGVDHKVVPRITFGGKAFHFSTKKENAFKAITKANFHSLPNCSKVFISFGEIDCRPNEGFISAASKLNRKIEDLVFDTARGFLGWFAEQNKSKNHTLFFFNVPAPIFQKNFSSDVNKETARVVKLFNNAFAKQILNYEFSIIDVHKFTLGNNGFSNELFHIDKNHLSSDALHEIEKKLVLS